MADKRTKIIIIDDNKVNILLAVAILKKSDYEIRTAMDGFEGLKLIKEFNPDVILLDIMMPGMSGIEVCRKLKTDDDYFDFKDIPVLMVTAKVEDSDLEEALEAGATDYIKKPISEIELSSRVRNAVREVEYLNELKKTNAELQKALDEVKTLSGLLPMCSHCHKVRDDKGYWNDVEVYISNHSDANISHGLCPDCISKLYPELSGDE